jgi:hypothetical protein
MDNLQNQVNARVEAFVAEITELARAAAYQALSAGLDTPIAGGRGAAVAIRGRRGGKRTAEEIAQMADAFLAHVTANPGQRMEHIATPELTLPVRKLLADGKLRVEGQKRATQYYPADGGSGSAKTTRAAKGAGAKAKRGRGRPKKKA